MSDFDRVAHDRVVEPLERERVALVGEALIALVPSLVESWEVFHVTGKAPPYGVIDAGKILIGPRDMPLAGLAYSKERGRWRITHVWVEEDARERGIGSTLVKLYQQHVSKKVIFVGPFSPGGRALAESVGAKIENG